MLSKVLPLVVAMAVLAPLRVEAQVSQYGQCGGVGYTGSTECGAGMECNAINSCEFSMKIYVFDKI